MNPRNISYAIGILPSIKVAMLLSNYPTIASILIGAGAFAFWLALVRWMQK